MSERLWQQCTLCAINLFCNFFVCSFRTVHKCSKYINIALLCRLSLSVWNRHIQGYLVASDIKICIRICILVHMLLNDIHAKKLTWIHTSLIYDHLCPSPQHSILHLLCSMPSLIFFHFGHTHSFHLHWLDRFASAHFTTTAVALQAPITYLPTPHPPLKKIFLINFSAQMIYLCVDVGDVWSYVCIRVDEEK